MKAGKMSHWKSFLLIALVTFLIIGTVPIGGILSIAPSDSTTTSEGVATASRPTRIHVVPSSLIDTSLTPGSTFTVDINVSDVYDLFSWQVIMSWKTSLLDCTKLSKGDFLAEQPEGTSFMRKITNAEGWCGFGETTIGFYPGVSGNGTLGSIEFRVDETGSTVLNITDPVGLKRTYWQNSFLMYPPFTPENGYFSNTEVVVQYELTIGVEGSGTTDPDPGSYMYDEDTPVTVDAIPDSGWELDHWDLDGANVGSDDPYIVTMDSDHILTAVFVETVPTQHRLTVNSDPISDVQFTLDGTPHTTPWSDLLDEGTYTIVMPPTWTTGTGDLYEFDQWEDTTTNPTRTISLTSDKTVTAYYVYVPETHTLTVNSEPIDRIEFTVDGVTQTTPYSASLVEGSHTIVMPSTWGIYDFDEWEDASTNRIRTISLTADMIITAYYVKRQWTLSVDSSPITGVDFTIDGTHATPWSSLLDEGTYTVVMPPTWTVGIDLYNFDHWEDFSTTPSRTISLTADMTMTAYYVLSLPQYELIIQVVGSGTTVPSPDTYILDAGTEYTVVAFPDSGWMLDHWDLDGANVGSDDTYIVIMDSAHILTAVFVEEVVQYRLTVESSPISGIEFTVDDIPQTTPWSGLLDEGSHTVVMPSTWGIYDFDEWDDGSTIRTRTISLTADMTVTAYYVKRQWTLSVDSSPITGVDFTLDGTHTTPWSNLLDEGGYTVVMPPTWTVGTDVYNFDEWEDGSTNPTRTISLTADMTVTAYYVLAPKYWTLTVNSDPISGVEFTIDDATQYTSWTDDLLEGPHTVVMPASWDVYDFDEWEDGSTNPTRVIDLTADLTVTAYYVKRQWTLNVDSSPITGVDFTIDGTHATPWSSLLDEGTYTVVMPPTWTVGPDLYNFDEWEDGSTNPTRTVSLTADTSIMAYYVLAVIPETTISLDPSTVTANPGESFTIDIKITDAVEPVYSWGLKLGWGKPGLLECSPKDIDEGPFLNEDWMWMTFFAVSINPTYIDVGCTMLELPPAGVTGSGVLATVTFTVGDTGNATLDLYDTTLAKTVDTTLVPIDHTAIDGYFYTTHPVAQPIYDPPYFGHFYVPEPGRPIVGESITFNASACYDPDDPFDPTPGGIVSYTWDFGDGTGTITVSDPIITHTYTTAGTYFLTLYVTDDDGETSPTITESLDIKIHDVAVISVTASPTTVEVGEPVTITVTAKNEGTEDETFDLYVYADLDTTEIGDEIIVGTMFDISLDAGVLTVPLEFTWETTGVAEGTYTISAEVSEVPNETDTADNTHIDGIVDVTLPEVPPVASFTYSPISPAVDETVTFDASASYDPDGTIVSYAWDFGDTTTGTGEITTHAYTTADTYTVTLTATDNDGLTDTTTATITVSPPELEPPVASFIYSPVAPTTGETVTFDASASYDPDGTIVSYAWDFGDTTTGTGEITTHTYADDGTYTVTLTVTDNDGLSDATSEDITVLNRPPVAIFTESAEIVDTGESITFDASESHDPDGGIVSYEWDFGDGTSATGMVVDHSYVDDGAYLVTLTVTDDDGATNSASATKTVLNRPPVAMFTESASDVHVGEVIYFDASASNDPDGSIMSYFWDFGDATTATGVEVEHAYDAEGTYTVTLTVTDDDGATDTATAIKTVSPPAPLPPVASFTYSPVSPVVDETVTFDASASYDPDGTIVSFEWEFGDGTFGTGEITTHAYTTADTYTVTLTVTDNDGLTDTTTQTITVSLLPPEDVTPPTITINEPMAIDYLISETITLDFTAVDTESGVASISATLNGLTVESGESIELYTLGVGSHTLTVTAVDNAGNSATETVEFNVIATIGSLQDLVTIFWESGFFYSPKGIYTSLIKKLYAAEAYIDAGEIDDAKRVLGAFINQLEAQAGKHVSEPHAYILIEAAQYVIDHL